MRMTPGGRRREYDCQLSCTWRGQGRIDYYDSCTSLSGNELKIK